MPASDSPYQRLAAAVNSPMYVVTAASGDARAGCLVGFSVQCSIDPLRHLVCLSKANRTFEVACGCEWLVVHALHVGDDEVASLFGGVTDRDVDKFACCAWHEGPGGAPVIDGCDWFAGRIPINVVAGEGTVIDSSFCFKHFYSKRDVGLRVGRCTTIWRASLAADEEGVIEIGDYCYIANASLVCSERIRIGSHVMIADGVTIADSDFHPLEPAARLAEGRLINRPGLAAPLAAKSGQKADF